MNNWWSELEIMKRNVAEQQEQLQLAYIKIKELSDIVNKERNDFGYIVVNDKRWQDNSDGWVRSMHASNERKQKRMSQQGYKVEIVFTQPLDKDDPADWILDAVTEGKFAEFTNHIHATSVSPIDLESDEYKWLRDATS
jgi:hypothetical protein